MERTEIIQKVKKYKEQYSKSLLDDVIPFWLKNSPDNKNEGYFTCLERDGKVYDTDKFMWMQGRQLYMLSKFYNHIKKDPKWLEICTLGANFLKKYGRNADGDFYFSLTAEGKPLVQPYNIFSDYFCGMGFAQYAKAADDEESKRIAITIFNNLPERRKNPKKQYFKGFPGTRPMDALNIYMIDTNFCLEVKDAIPEVEIKQRVIKNVETILNNFIDPQNGILHEAVTPDFKNMDNHDGRLICPGHGIECTWFIMDTALLLNQTQWIPQACDILLKTLKYGWDEEFGGVLYFKDIKNKPLDRLDWDQKLWWVHNETLIALILAYKITKEPVYFEWFEKVHNYSWKTFADPEYGEWFGYINRQGRPLLTLKGGKWKGFFHVPRFLYLCHKILEQILEEEN